MWRPRWRTGRLDESSTARIVGPRQEMRQALKGGVPVARLCVAGSQYLFEHDAIQIFSRVVSEYISSALGMDEDGYRVRTDKDASDSERQGNQGQGRRWRSTQQRGAVVCKVN